MIFLTLRRLLSNHNNHENLRSIVGLVQVEQVLAITTFEQGFRQMH